MKDLRGHSAAFETPAAGRARVVGPLDFGTVTQSPMINGIVVMAGDSDKVKKAATEGVTPKATASMAASAPAK